MLFVDEPYISDFLRQTIRENQWQVVNTANAQRLGLLPGTSLLSEEEAVQLARHSPNELIYTTSENSIGWITQHLTFTDTPRMIEQFKNKAKFRAITHPLNPDFFFKEVALQDLEDVKFAELPCPFIIKPNVGFFSMGVHKVTSANEWQATCAAIHAEMDALTGIYPDEVLNTGSFIIEQIIDGDEFAIDAYFDSQGVPVILDILHHPFSSDADVSDRVYTTSKAIIEANLDEFSQFLSEIGRLTGVHRFPVHVEIRRTRQGVLIPIEVNPNRFGGWCSTPDLAFAAYGINPYLYYFNQQKPDWQQLLKEKDGKSYSVVVLDNSTGKRAEEIASFDFERLLACFEKPLELRPIDYFTYPVFGFVFVETRAGQEAELDTILRSDLNEFVHLK